MASVPLSTIYTFLSPNDSSAKSPSSILSHPQPTPRPSLPPLPSHTVIAPISTPTHVQSFRRINSLLLPIPYPDSFYKAILPSTSSPASSEKAFPPPLALVALHNPSSIDSSAKRKRDETPGQEESQLWKVIGGIKARLEPDISPILPSTSRNIVSPAGEDSPRLYIQTLCLLSPHRAQSIASHMLQELLCSAVQEYSVTLVYAHVWEANEEAADWYRKRGFTVEEVVLEGYYRRLRPGGARVVWKKLGVEQMLEMKGMIGRREGDVDTLPYRWEQTE